MGDINRLFSGKPNVTTTEANRHADMLIEIKKGLTPYDRMILNDERDLLVGCIRGLGEKGATELLGKLGMWLVMNDVHPRR